MIRHRAGRAVASAIVSALVLAGCGGGGGKGGSGGVGGGGGPADSRSVMLDTITAKFDTFDHTNPDDENQQILALLKTKPELSETGITSAGAWGRFADGTTLIVCNNLDVTAETRSVQPIATRAARRSSNSTRATGIPLTGKLMLGTSLGSFFEAWGARIPNLFSGQGYTRIQPDSTVDALKSFSDISVLYLFGHGGAFPIRTGGPPVYNVWTATVRARDGSTDTAYLDDLHDGTLTYFVGSAYAADADPKIRVRKTSEVHYAFTSKFVTKYWSGRFNPDSLVFMNTCSSASLDAVEFESACLLAGASQYLGWTDRMRLGEALDSAAFLFDRMVGSNSTELGSAFLENPQQRAFSIIEVLGEMAKRQRPLGASYTLDTSVAPVHKPGEPVVPGSLALLSAPSNLEQLAPSIHDLAVNEQADELAINGSFGSVAGKVFIADGSLTIKSWDANTIICALPRSGPASVGTVEVSTGGHHSNDVPLTGWHGTGTYTVEEAGSLKMVMTFDMHFRGDVHGPRIAPGVAPDDPACSFNHTLTTTGTYAFSGGYTDPVSRTSWEWSGAGTMASKLDTSPSADNSVSFFGAITNGKWELEMLAFATKGNHVHQISRDLKGVITDDGHFDQDGVGPGNFDGPGSQFQSTAPASFTIPGGSRQTTLSSGYNASLKATHTLQWTSFTADSAPTSQTTRSARIPRAR